MKKAIPLVFGFTLLATAPSAYAAGHASPAAAVESSVSSKKESIPDNDRSPQFAFTYPSILADEPVTVVITSNSDADRASVEAAIRKSIVSSDTSRTKVDFQLDWKSDREFTVSLPKLADREVIRFDFTGAKNKRGVAFIDPSQVNPPHVTVKRSSSDKPSVVTKNVRTGQEKRSDAMLAERQYGSDYKVKSVLKTGPKGAAATYALLYGAKGHQLVDPVKGTAVTLPLVSTKGKSPFADWMLYQDELYSDRFYEGHTFMVKGHTDVYKIDLKSKKPTPLWSSKDKPIYGIASSPDGTKVAVLVSHDTAAGPWADLLVLDTKGKTVYKRSKFSFTSKSDGVLSSYPIAWTDNRTVVAKTEISVKGSMKLGYRSIDIKANKVKELADQQNAAEKKALSKEQTNWLTFYWSPDRSKVAYTVRNQLLTEIWVYDTAKGKFQLAEAGTWIGWLNNDTIAMYERDSNEMPQV